MKQTFIMLFTFLSIAIMFTLNSKADNTKH